MVTLVGTELTLNISPTGGSDRAADTLKPSLRTIKIISSVAE